MAWEQYMEHSKRLKKMVREKKKLQSNQLADAIKNKSSSDMAKWISHLRRRALGESVMCMLPTDQPSLDSYADHFASVSADPNATCPSFDQQITILPYTHVVTQADILEGLHFTKSGKAAGLDGIRVELIRPVSFGFSKMMESLSNAIFRCGITPSSWHVANCVPIWKHKGSKTDISQYRPISLLSIPRKIFERAILKMISKEGGDPNIAQGGFRKGRGTLDQAYVLDSIIKRARRNNLLPWLAFLDIKAAYDTVDREKLWGILAARGCSERI